MMCVSELIHAILISVLGPESPGWAGVCCEENPVQAEKHGITLEGKVCLV